VASSSRRAIGVLFAIALAAGFAQFGAVASLNDVARHFGHVEATGSLRAVVGLSGSAIGIGLAVVRLASLAALPVSALADHRGRTRVVRAALAGGLLVTSAAALSPNYWFFVACFALARPLLTAVSTVVQVLTVELSSTAQRIHRLVIMAAGAGMGSGLSAILHGLIRGPGSFRWLFAITLVPVVVITPLVGRIPEPRRHGDDLARLGVVPPDARGRLTSVALVAFAAGMVTGPANGFAFVYAEGILKLAPHVVAEIVVVSAATGVAGLVASRALAHVIGRRATVAIGLFALAVTSSVAYSGGRVSFVLGYMVGVAAAGLFAPAASALSTEIFSRRVRSTAAGWVTLAGILGATAGLALFGVVGDSVHVAAATSLRLPAMVTFLPLLPTLLLLVRVPETRGVDID
jgi:MFS family permease